MKKKNTQKEVSGDKFSEVGSKRKNNIQPGAIQLIILKYIIIAKPNIYVINLNL